MQKDWNLCGKFVTRFGWDGWPLEVQASQEALGFGMSLNRRAPSDQTSGPPTQREEHDSKTMGVPIE
jgi:hypothetical protein